MDESSVGHPFRDCWLIIFIINLLCKLLFPGAMLGDCGENFGCLMRLFFFIWYWRPL
jgi:hypothetical protein